ncbi:MAG: hypothetical protein R3352_08850 [Salinisphaeraceae bacterium]|nr:hypothetical protein [Salinisphaeraceae bacterium]
MHIKHFVLSDDGHIREFSSERAFKVANGIDTVPELADAHVRYVQVQFDEQTQEEPLQVVTAGAMVHFDAEGRVLEVGAVEPGNMPITEFEQETCIQLALDAADIQPTGITSEREH